MMHRVALLSALCAGALLGQGPVIKRDFNEFLNAQGNSFWSWSDRNTRSILVDYLGVYNRFYSLHLDTQIDGSVTERLQSDGTTLVTVVIHTTDALTYGFDSAKGAGPVFGYSVWEVKNQQKPPALGDALVRLEFVNTGLGDPFPVITNLPQDRVKRIMLESTAKGSMRSISGVPEGTPGTALTTQVGLNGNPVWGSSSDTYPVEMIKFKPNGK